MHGGERRGREEDKDAGAWDRGLFDGWETLGREGRGKSRGGTWEDETYMRLTDSRRAYDGMGNVRYNAEERWG